MIVSQVRILTSADAAAFQAIRLRGLGEHPEAFGSSLEEEADTPLEKTAQSLGKSLPNNPLFGAFVDDRLVGVIGLFRASHLKMRHRATIGAMYVAPEARGQKLGRALLDAAIEYARSLEGVEDVVLAVTVGNEAARALYVSAGFQSYSIDPRLIYTNDRYYDVEWMILRLRPNAD
jgi:ribosomal protein S18 acetylase RimI-like enzyme